MTGDNQGPERRERPTTHNRTDRTTRPRASDYDPPAGASVFDDSDAHLSEEYEDYEDRAESTDTSGGRDNRSFSVPAPQDEPGLAGSADPHRYDPPGHAPAKPRRKRRYGRWILIGVLVLLIGIVAELLYLTRNFSSIDRVPVEQALTDPSSGGVGGLGSDGINFLVVGSDSRENIDPDSPDAGAIGDVGGERTDTVILVRVKDDGNLMLPLPRDLWVPISGTGGEQRINTAIQGGPERLINTVQDALGVPVHHYAEVDFAGFKNLVDAVGGIDITFDHVTYDRKSGLDVSQPGTTTLDGVQALAYVRSRAYTEVIDGQPKVDGTGDLGRIERQQIFLRATLSKMSGVRDPLKLNSIAGSITGDIRIDETLSFREAVDFGRLMSATTPETVELPVANATRGSAAVLVMADGAQEALQRFR